MKAEFFHAVCPLEIGDTVAIKLDNKAQQTEAMPEALYIPPHATVLVGGKDIHIATVTDIATMHYLKSGKTQFLYELDGKGSYKPMKVTMPVQMFDKERICRRTETPGQIITNTYGSIQNIQIYFRKIVRNVNRFYTSVSI